MPPEVSALLPQVLAALTPDIIWWVKLLAPAMGVLSALVWATKLFVGNKPKRPDNLWRGLACAYGVIYQAIVTIPGILAAPPASTLPAVLLAFQTLCIGIGYGVANILAYHAWKNRKKVLDFVLRRKAA